MKKNNCRLKEELIAKGVIFPKWENEEIMISYRDIVRTFAPEDYDPDRLIDIMLQNSGIAQKSLRRDVKGITLFTPCETYTIYHREILNDEFSLGVFAHEAVHALSTPFYNHIEHDTPFASAFGYFVLLNKNLELVKNFFGRDNLDKIMPVRGEIIPGECDKMSHLDGLCLAVQAHKISQRYGKDAGLYFLGLAHDYLNVDRALEETLSFYRRNSK